MGEKVRLYALSTCGWCKRTMEWMKNNNVDCDTLYVDKLEGDERKKILEEISERNPRRSFPTVVADEGRVVIVGYKPEEFEKELKK